MRSFDALGRKKVVIGLVHLLPLPGTPFFEPGNTERALDKAVRDAIALWQGGADGCLIQTVDRVYSTGDEADYARVAAVAAITRAVADATPAAFQIGVQIMINALKASAAVATVCGGSFLRCTALVGATLTPSGVVEASPLEFLTYRARIGGNRLKLIAEVESMHFHWMGGRPVPDVARTASRMGADAVEVADPDEDVSNRLVRDIKRAHPNLPVILGGHTNHENAARRLAEADGAFVGSCLKSGAWDSDIDAERVRDYVEIVAGLA